VTIVDTVTDAANESWVIDGVVFAIGGMDSHGCIGGSGKHDRKHRGEAFHFVGIRGSDHALNPLNPGLVQEHWLILAARNVGKAKWCAGAAKGI
jgi:hypothetical protein